MGKPDIHTIALRDFASIEKTRYEWVDLINEARTGCPFVHPEWAIAWARHFVDECDLEFLAFREGSADGKLVGIAPLYRKLYSSLGFGAVALVPIGTGRSEAITEVMQVLISTDRTQEVMREMVQHIGDSADWDWGQLPVAPSHGWPVPQWLGTSSPSVLRHDKTKACLVFEDLPDTPELLAPRLKRNLKESLRRTRNRSAKLGGVELGCADDRESVGRVLPHLFALHRARSRMPGKVVHPDVVSGEVEVFLSEVVPRMADGGLARVHFAERDGRPIAAQLVLSDGYGDYASISGFDPDYWDLGLNTMLIYEALVAAIVGGRDRVNLSAGPNIAKGRWTSKIECYQEFSIVRQARRSRFFYVAYLHASIIRDARGERLRHKVR